VARDRPAAERAPHPARGDAPGGRHRPGHGRHHAAAADLPGRRLYPRRDRGRLSLRPDRRPLDADRPRPAGHASDHTATPLSDGSVLVVGGGDRGGVPYTTAVDRYDPGGDRWIAAGTLQAARSRHTATRLLDGRVLVAGGYGLGSDTAEIFADATLQPSACFTETDRCLTGRFLAYWTAHGGLARNGFPLTPERREVLEDGKEYTVQYFERVRMEYHPENAGTPYEMLLGQFGRRVYLGGSLTSLASLQPVPAVAGQTYFPATGHNVDARFFAYWQANGGLAQFGYPLAEATTETFYTAQGMLNLRVQ